MLEDNTIAFFLIDHTPTGGVQRVSSKLISLMKKNRLNVSHLISLRNKYPTPRFNFPDLSIHVLSGNTATLKQELSRYLEENNINTLIFQADNMSISLDVLAAAKSANCKAIGQYHGSPYAYLRKYISWKDIAQKPVMGIKALWATLQYPFKKLKQKRFLMACENGLVCVSKGSENELKKLHKLPISVQNRITHIHNPMSFSTPSEFPPKKNGVVYVSRLERKHKNSFLAIEAWQKIAKQYPDWTFHILGDGSLRGQMEKFAQDRGIKNVVFHGMVNNVADYLLQSKIAINTSNTEGFGQALAEAISMGNAPVSVASDGGVIDLVGNKCGLISPKKDANELAQNISLLIDNDELRDKISQKAMNNLRSFSDEIIIDKWKKILQEFLLFD